MKYVIGMLIALALIGAMAACGIAGPSDQASVSEEREEGAQVEPPPPSTSTATSQPGVFDAIRGAFRARCEVSLNQAMTNSHTFDKPCGQVSHADLWWTAGWYHETAIQNRLVWSDEPLMGAPGINVPEEGCLVSATADGFSSASTSAHVGRPCAAVSVSERLRLANASQGATVWTTPWYSMKWPEQENTQ